MGATLKRLAPAGSVVSGLWPVSMVFSINAISCCFLGFSGVFTDSVLQKCYILQFVALLGRGMASITKIEGKAGVRYRAQIRLKDSGAVVYSEAKTFAKRVDAKAWADRLEYELRQPGMLEKVRHRGITVGQVLEWYRDDFDGRSKFGRTKLSHIEYLIKHPVFSALDAIELTTRDLVDHAQSRARIDGAQPATVNNDFVWLSNAWQAVRIARNVPLSQQVIEDAAFLCRKEGLIGRSKQRSRRPKLAELEQ